MTAGGLTKNEIVLRLAAHFGYREYLEFRTPWTGPDCAVNPTHFHSYARVLYRTPVAPEGSERQGCLDGIAAHSFSIALLDPWHSYDQSRADLEDVFAKLAPGGAMVVHDCWPREEITRPDGWQVIPERGEWSGETYAAYVDFVTSRTDLDYLTVDADFGCGIVFKRPGAATDARLVEAWQANRSHGWLQGDGHALLRLVSAAEFRDTYAPSLPFKCDDPCEREALIMVNVNPGTPFCIDIDTAPRFRLGIFDYSGSGHVPRLPCPVDLQFSHKVSGKGELLAHLASQDLGDYDYIAEIDHDVMLSVSAINRLLFIGRLHQLDLFQPSLSHDSFISHPHLANRPGFILRETTFVETMTPFFSAIAFALARDSFGESISAWGLDFIWSSRVRNSHGKLAVIDAVMARHVNPVRSNTWRFANGESPPAELERALIRHGLTNYELR